MFLQGEIVKSKQRTEKHELFLMVLFDPKPSPSQFNAVVLKDFSSNEEPGDIANNWNTDQFELSNWNELKRLL
jgi:hypothetical protein